jgi:hypothetical protein
MPSTPFVVEGGLLAKAYVQATDVYWLHCPHRGQIFIKQQTNRSLSHAAVLAVGSWQLAVGSWQLAVGSGAWLAQFPVGAIRGYEGRDLSRSGS